MKKTFLASWFMIGLASGPLLGPAQTPPAPAKSVPLTARIDALLRPHLQPSALPVSLPNPFVVVRGSAELTEAAGPVTGPEPRVPPAATEEASPATDGELLAQATAQLKIGGTIYANNVTQLMINRNTYKEGDFLTLDAKPVPLHVQIVRLTRDELTLRYNDVTQTLPLKAATKP
jgi:hypothetical protein